MADDSGDKASKTEQPTGKRLAEARSKGQVPLSQEVKNLLMVLGSLVVIMWLGGMIVQSMGSALYPFLASPDQIRVTDESLARVLGDAGLAMATPIAIAFGLLMFAAIMGVFGQIGFYFEASRLQPSFDSLNPMEGIKKLFSWRSVVELVKKAIKFALVSSIIYWLFWPEIKNSTWMIGMGVAEIGQEIIRLSIYLVGAIIGIYIVVAIADVAYTRWDYIQNLKMTKSEVQDENRQSEGDPHVKGKLRHIRAQRARQRIMAAVPKATVVVTNPTHFAVALKYEPENMAAPLLVAKGADLLARRIRELATEHDVPIVENPPLARTLYATVELDEEIPVAHYRAVAEIISYVFRLKKKHV